MKVFDITAQEAEIAKIEEELGLPETASDAKRLRDLTRRHKHLKDVVETGRALRDAQSAVEDCEKIISENEDHELVELAKSELSEMTAKAEELEKAMMVLLLPKDPCDEANTIMEIRAGTGGEEAALFASELFRMYSRYAERQGWKIETMNTSPAAAGGLKEIIFSIQGDAVYSHMKYEAGVHRVQRVPETETQGRIHTSAASVVVLPEQEEVTVDIKPEDLRIDIYRSTGAGGQHVNTTDSAIRITHLPTGLVVTCQDERSQYKTKAKAMRVLHARLLEKELQDAATERSAQRTTKVGSGDRSDKNRTYNFPQNRVTDHRIGLTVHALGEIMDGDLDRLILPLIEHDTEEMLKESINL
ncbi:peptide chain release factor 1 [bacterium]|nr:peptide chain release factor 1 [bacterium]